MQRYPWIVHTELNLLGRIVGIDLPGVDRQLHPDFRWRGVILNRRFETGSGERRAGGTNLGGHPQRGNPRAVHRDPRSRDGEVLASVRSVWVALDAKTLRPRRVTEQLRSFFESCERGRKDPDGPG